jgi:DNA-binding CsgD family transcriptional regulator
MARLEIGRSPLGVAASMFAAVFVVRLSVHDTTSGVSLLYTVPILLVSIACGVRKGFAAATLAVGLVVLWTRITGVDLGAVAMLMRAVGFYAVPYTLWLARPNLAATQSQPAPVVEPEPVSEPAKASASSPRPLTPRESEVLGLLAAGHTNAQIADKLVLSVRTVESHRANLQRKLGRPSRPELVQYALSQGLTAYDSRISF